MIPLCGFVIITWINGFLDLKKQAPCPILQMQCYILWNQGKRELEKEYLWLL